MQLESVGITYKRVAFTRRNDVTSLPSDMHLSARELI